MKRMLLLISVNFIFFMTMFFLKPVSGLPLSASPTLDWDSRLNGLNVSYQPAANCSQGCWRLVSAQYQDEQQSQGLHHIWGRVRDQNGAEQGGMSWTVGWPDGSQPLTTKPPGEWADFPISACYFPDQGQSGGHRAFAGLNEQQSDVVYGMGLPYCLHVSFRLTWQWDAGGETPTATPTPSQTPTATPVPPLENTPTPTATATSQPTVSPSPSNTPTATVSPSPSNTPTATVSPSPSNTPTATFTPNPNVVPKLWLPFVTNPFVVSLPLATPIATATQTATATATQTAIASATQTITTSGTETATATATETATATLTPTPASTPLGNGMTFAGEVVERFTNCGLTQVIGVVHDSNGLPLPGTRVRLTWDAGDAQTYYTTAGQYIRPEITDESGWEVYLNSYPVANSWRVAVVDAAGGLLSEDVRVYTEGHCNAGAANVIKVRFFMPDTSPPTATVTPTVTRTPTATVTPTVTRTPTATPSSPQPTATGGTATVTPTASATPTPDTGGMTYGGEVVQRFTNCDLTQVIGVVHDANGEPLPGTRVRLTWNGADTEVYATAGHYVGPETDESGWEFLLNRYPIANTWRVAIVDQAGNLLSEDLSVSTDGHCNSGAANVIKVRFFMSDTSPPTATVTPTVTRTPTATGGTPTVTPTASATPLPSATPDTGGMTYGGEVVQTFTNCGLTQVIGVVHDANGQPLPGTRVRLTWNAPDAQVYQVTAGHYVRPETDQSGWEFVLNNHPVANTWRVAIVDQAGNLLSEDLSVSTEGHCNSGAANVIKVRFFMR